MKENLYKILPHFLQNLMVTLFNIKAYRRRYGGKYHEFRKIFYENRTLSLEDLLVNQKERYRAFIIKSMTSSPFYADLYADTVNPDLIENISRLPILTKEDLRTNIHNIVIKTDENLGKLMTGGTTGKSLTVFGTALNSQERFAMLDDFRSRFGYKLGKRTAWLSGKHLLTQRDTARDRFWKTDLYHNVRYYSTFHIKENNIKHYLDDLIKYQPEYMVGFPSTIYEIAKYGLKYQYDFPSATIKAIFPTAETLTSVMRNDIETFFKTKMYNQYASSEGAPFIIECINGNLHMELQSGVFEVLDENNLPAQSGRLVVTSFTTEGTPLIRYDIGDSLNLEPGDKICGCGNNNPLVKEILGRSDDFVYSPENGKVNIVNIANAIKDVKGIIKYQVIQDELNALQFKILIDKAVYNNLEEQRFIENWRDRVGQHMKFQITYVDDIDVQESGKFRVVRNNIKHLLNS